MTTVLLTLQSSKSNYCTYINYRVLLKPKLHRPIPSYIQSTPSYNQATPHFNKKLIIFVSKSNY